MYDQRFGTSTDNRECILCHEKGDGNAELHGRLLNYKRGGWVHVNCIWWSSDVHEHKTGALMNVAQSVTRCLEESCTTCQQLGASLKCSRPRCDSMFHIVCAKKSGGIFLEQKVC